MSSEPAGGAAGQASLLLGQIVHIAAGANKSSMRGKRVRLVCGTTSMYTGLDGLTAIIRCHLRCDPCDGSIYVFCDAMGSKLKYIEWDGQSFRPGETAGPKRDISLAQRRGLDVWSRSVKKI